jgi:hypothetical protein
VRNARTEFAELRIGRYPHQPLGDRVWQLRHNLTAYDTTFIALAEALDAALITCDSRLAAARDRQTRIEVFRCLTDAKAADPRAARPALAPSAAGQCRVAHGSADGADLQGKSDPRRST